MKSIPESSSSSNGRETSEHRPARLKAQNSTLHFCFRRRFLLRYTDLSARARHPSFEFVFGHRLKGIRVHLVRRAALFNGVQIEHEPLVEFLVGMMNKTMTDEDIAGRELDEPRDDRCVLSSQRG